MRKSEVFSNFSKITSSEVRALHQVNVGIVYSRFSEFFLHEPSSLKFRRWFPLILSIYCSELWKSVPDVPDTLQNATGSFSKFKEHHICFQDRTVQQNSFFQSSHCFLCPFQNFDDVESSENEIWKTRKPSESVLRVRVDQDNSLVHTWRSLVVEE